MDFTFPFSTTEQDDKNVKTIARFCFPETDDWNVDLASKRHKEGM
jgi:hypothetical protein